MKLDIKNGEIKQIIVNDVVLPLKKKMMLSEAQKIEQIAGFLEEYIDFSNIGSEKEDRTEEGFQWTKEELISFLDQTDSEFQKIFLKELAKKPERLDWKDVKEAMDEGGHELLPFSMAGVLSCFARRAKHFGKKEDFWESIWDNKTNGRYYTLKEPYRRIFKNYFGD